MNWKNKVLFYFFLVFAFTTVAQTKTLPDKNVSVFISDSIIDASLKSNDFVYVVPRQLSTPASWREKWNSFVQSVFKKISELQNSDNFKIVATVALFVTLIYFISTSGFTQKRNTETNTAETEWDLLYQQARKDDAFLQNLAMFESKESWAEAVRWMFIKYLSQLEKQQMIVWQSGKTNLDYCKELSHPQIKQVYTALMEGYNDAWFGHHLTDNSAYLKYKDLAMTAITALNEKVKES